MTELSGAGGNVPYLNGERGLAYMCVYTCVRCMRLEKLIKGCMG